MASPRRKYIGRVDLSNEPVMAAPTAAKLAPAVETPKPAEPLSAENDAAVDQAALAAVKARIAETMRAQDLRHEAADHLERLADEPQYQPQRVLRVEALAQPQPRCEAPAPVRQQSTFYSAPPSRDSLSLGTGKPVAGPMRLTAAERADARIFGITDEQYLAGKLRMLDEKKGGFHQGG